MTVDSYLEAGQDERLRTLNDLAKSFEHAIGGIVSGSGFDGGKICAIRRTRSPNRRKRPTSNPWPPR